MRVGEQPEGRYLLLMPIKALKTGMVLAQPIFHPRQDEIVLLEKGFRLDTQFIARLREFDIRAVWVEFSGLEELNDKVNPRIAAGHIALYEALQSSILELRDRVAVEMNLHHYRRAIESILLDIVDDPDHAVLMHQLRSCSQRIAGHLANCCYLALLVGAHLSGYLRQQRRALPAHIAENTHRLGLGALLHDIGKVGMPQELQKICILDHEASWPEYRAHTSAGYERVREHLPGAAANVVLHHHQRFDGNGFPDRFERTTRSVKPPPMGEQIHVFSRIVAAIDVLDHLLHRRGHAIPAVVALYKMRTAFPGSFDPVIIDAVTRLVPPFMIGTVVELTDGNEAVVVQNHLENPCRPTVRVLSGSIYKRGAKVKGPPVDLRLHREPQIAAVDGVSVRDYLFDLRPNIPAEATT